MPTFRGFIHYYGPPGPPGPSKSFEAGPGVSVGGKAYKKKNPALQAIEPSTQGHNRSDGPDEAAITTFSHTRPGSENGNSCALDRAERGGSTQIESTRSADKTMGDSPDSPLLINDDEDGGEKAKSPSPGEHSTSPRLEESDTQSTIPDSSMYAGVNDGHNSGDCHSGSSTDQSESNESGDESRGGDFNKRCTSSPAAQHSQSWSSVDYMREQSASSLYSQAHHPTTAGLEENSQTGTLIRIYTISSSVDGREHCNSSWTIPKVRQPPTASASRTGASVELRSQVSSIQLEEYDDGAWTFKNLPKEQLGALVGVSIRATTKVSSLNAEQLNDGSWKSDKLFPPTSKESDAIMSIVIQSGKITTHLRGYDNGKWTLKSLGFSPSTSSGILESDQAAGPLPHTSRDTHLSPQSRGRYSKKADALLQKLKDADRLPWDEIANYFPGRSPVALQRRYTKVVKVTERKARIQRARVAKTHQGPPA
ncbi:MAG: hypothetical protein M1822_006857 [Bathelium mastoideum]|nr:MAG: hypothetical protein M1822_006857 [Bathelium mastoideum]